MNISGLNKFRERLERLRPEEVMARALAEQAVRMAASIFVPGSPENEEWTHDTIQRLWNLGHFLRSEPQGSEGGDDAERRGEAPSRLQAD